MEFPDWWLLKITEVSEQKDAEIECLRQHVKELWGRLETISNAKAEFVNDNGEFPGVLKAWEENLNKIFDTARGKI